ncbi:hypothetical protein BU17DRAFT_45133 [Hysterangium stoloniferum]|nr:hypothetical protein BU17DRAFT_45133 [Hysterangium stoloniferum]
MHPSLRHLFRIIPQEALHAKDALKPALARHIPRSERPTVVSQLRDRQRDIGEGWPSNLRIERPLEKSALTGVSRKNKIKLLKLTRER